MTFSELLSDVYEDVGYQSSPAASVIARIKRHINEGLRVILGEPGLQRLNDSDSTLTVASVASTARMVVPEAVAKIHAITDRANDRRLASMSLGDYRRLEPDPASVTGTPTHYVPIGRVAVAVQPSDASTLYVKSTAAGDTGTAHIEGYLANSFSRLSGKAMTGATAVAIGVAGDEFVEVTDFYVTTAATGIITLHEDSGTGTELARIVYGRKRPRYTGFYLWPTPAAAVTYYVDYRREVFELIEDADEPPLPADYHYLLTAYARMRHWEKQDDTRFVVAKQQFQQGLSRLKYATQTGPDELPVASRGRFTGHSRLGGYFPADTWTRG